MAITGDHTIGLFLGVCEGEGLAIDPGREEDGTIPRCEQPDMFAPYWPRILMVDGRPDQSCEPSP